MAKFHLRTGSSRYQKERAGFVAELKQFHETRGTPIRHMPVMNGKEIDLYLLYMLVTHHGGWTKVNGQGMWDNMLKQLDLPTACVNGGVAIRQIYLRYLERWERIKGGGPGGAAGAAGDVDSLMGDMDDDRPRRSGYGAPRARNTVALTYNHTQHNVPDHIRESNGLPPLQRLGGAMERLALSLLSPLPNEQDFALSVCTILAADSANKLPVISSPHIIDFLLGHTAVYNHPSLREVIGKSYIDARDCNMEWYWLEHARPSGILELLDEERFPIQGLAMQAIVSQLSLKSYLADDGTMLLPDDKELPVIEGSATAMLADEDGIMAYRCPGGTKDLITRRISQVASIMRNLSFHDDNIPILAKHITFLRFIILCVNSSMSSIRQAGLDTLGNVSVELVIRDPATCLLSRHLLATLTAALHSDDRARILSALEVLNKLAQNESNEDVLLRCLEQKVYEQVCSYLTLHDIMLLVVTLECMYALTTLGERSCDYIVKVHGVIDTLVSLITVEAQSYGPKACILMRVVETVSGPLVHNPNIPTNNPQMVSVAQNVNQSVPASAAQPSVQQQPVTLLQVASNVQSNPVTVSPLVQQPTGNVTVQQQHAHQQVIQENEQFALAWLRTTWEPCASNIRLDASEVYKQYLACCTKVGRKGVISPLHFPRCVRSVFGGMVGPNPVKGPNGENLQFYMGIKQRPQQNKIQPQPTNMAKAGPASPILKAQLSKAEQNKIQGVVTSTLSQMIDSSVMTPKSPPLLQITTSTLSNSAAGPSTQQSSNTTLIKHLLAHKVSVAPPQPTAATDRMSPQVTQRQNQQKLMGQITTNTPVVPISSPNPMEIDAEALISCSTITSSGVTSTNPMNASNIKVTTTNPIVANNIHENSSNGTENQRPVGENADESSLKTANPILTNLVEKKSSPPGLIPHTRPSVDEDEEPPSKKVKSEESVSSTAANLYAALAASALEDEEELLAAQNESTNTQSTNSGAGQPVKTESIKAEVTPKSEKVPSQTTEPSPVTSTVQTPIIVHANTNPKPVMSNAQLVPPLQLIATPASQQSLGFVSGGVVPHKTIIILQSTNPNGPITLTVNNAGGLDENTLNNLITQATDALSQQQSLALSQQANNPTSQASTGVIQSAQGIIQPTIIQTNQQNILNASNVIKQQIVQGQTQLVQSQQPLITQQPQPQIISAGQVLTPGNQQMLVQGNQVLSGNQQIIVGNQQLIATNPQLVVGNQQIIMSNQQVISGAQIISGNQQFISMPGNQQRIVSGNSIIVDQQGNRQLLSANSNIILTNQHIKQQQQQDKKPLVTSPPLNQGPVTIQKTTFIVNSQQMNNNVNSQADSLKTVNVVKTVENNTQQNTKLPPASPQKIPDEPWVCQWRGCDTVFESAAAVYNHACSVHCTKTESPCLWAHCDQLPRKRFSLMTHLQDRHCSVDALKTSLAQRRKGIVPAVQTPMQIPAPSSTMERIDSPGADGGSNHPGYAPNAALHAIKRHAVDFLNPRELMQRAEASRNTVEPPDDNEGPVTKSIRLTAALILRNIVIYSHTGRRLLRGYEPHLAGIALSSVEASRTVAQVLYDMNCI